MPIIVIFILTSFLGISPVIAFAQCKVAISYAYLARSNVLVNAHSTHLGPPGQMVATFKYENGQGGKESLRVNPRIELDFNVYNATLPQNASNISVHVDTTVGSETSCITPAVNAPFYQPALWYSQLRPIYRGCELTIGTIGSPGIYVPWYYGGNLAWWYNLGQSDFHGIPVFFWSKVFYGTNCSNEGIDFKIMGDGLNRTYRATISAQNG